MNKNLKITDIDYSFKAHPVSGNLILKTGKEAIKQSVRTLLLINSFEKPFFVMSANLRNKLFDNFDFIIENDIIQRIKKILEIHEPRIVVEDVSINYGKTRETIDDVFIDTREQELVVLVTYTIIGEEASRETISLVVSRSR